MRKRTIAEYNAQSTENDREIAKKYSPDLNKQGMVSVKINKSITLHMTEERLKKYGKEYFVNKYKNKQRYYF